MKISKYISKKVNSFTDWFSGIWTELFSSSSSTSNTLTRSRSGATVDLTCPDTVNYDLAMSLYYNTQTGYKFGAFFCHSIIAIPLTFMGFPHFDVEKQRTQKQEKYWKERLDFYNDKLMMVKMMIQKICHITGTVAVYPYFNTKHGYVKLFLILPKYISDVYIDPNTHELTGLETSIHYSFKEDDKTYYFEEKKKYTETRIEITRIGNIPSWMRYSEIKRNPAGILPIIFCNDEEPEKFEGHSEFEKLLSLVKAYSEVNLSANEQAVNMKAKLVQTVDDWNKWKEDNGFTDINDISIENVDFIANRAPDEKTEFLVPQHLIDQLINLLKVHFHSLVETSGIPEIWWGLKTQGNHASAAEQAEVGLAYVRQKQQQATNPYYDLLDAIVKLDAMAYNQNPPENIIITWNELNTLTELEKSQVFDNWCTGIQKLMDKHAIDLETTHTLLMDLTNGKITDNFDDFREQLKKAGTLRAYLEQEYADMIGLNQDEDIDENTEDLEDIDEVDSEIKEEKGGNGHKKKYKMLV
jgi:hypothetical protein